MQYDNEAHLLDCSDWYNLVPCLTLWQPVTEAISSRYMQASSKILHTPAMLIFA
jgi:hypothetical protein